MARHASSSLRRAVVPVKPQIGIDELIAGKPFGKRIELRAVADETEQLFRLIGRDIQNPNIAARWADQAGHQIHERGFAGAIRSDQAGDPGRNREIDAIDAQHVAVKLRDVVEDDAGQLTGPPHWL